jgi:acyl-CoA synthetase (AMP-forming)/AMP-acid ligase II/acyl carrier protein/lauroyl/myristoyl acyltransferase
MKFEGPNDVTGGTTLNEDIAYWARHAPGNPALITDDGEVIDYGRLGDLLKEIGNAVQDAGCGRNTRIAIVHPGGVRNLLLLYGVAGVSSSVPLNPAETETGFVQLMTDRKVQCLAVLAEAYPAARRAAESIGLPVFDIAWDNEHPASSMHLVKASGPDHEKPVKNGPATPDDVALVLGTSGTTSKSKTIAISHRLFRSRAVVRQVFEKTTAADRCFNLNPLYLQGGISVCSVSLMTGGSVIVSTDVRTDHLFDIIDRLEPTWFSGSFTYIKSIINYARTNNPAVKLGQFRYIRPSSGAVDPDDSAEIEKIFGAPVVELYSSTECGSITINPLPPGVRKHGTVGRPVYCEVVILGDDDTFLSTGSQGEVLVRGRNVFTGYENNDAANEAAFFQDWFRTGDLGFLDEDGYLTLTGRINDMISRGGVKVSPAEVEAAIAMHPDVEEAAAFGIPHDTLGEVVGVAVVAKGAARLTEADIRRYAQLHLAPVKVPQRIIFMDALPRLSAGKLQRGALVEMMETVAHEVVVPTEEGEPRTALEQNLRRLWAKILDCDADRIGRDDNFVMLGGDSLSAATLYVEIDAAFGVTLPPEAMNEEGQSVASMAALIERLLVISTEASDCLNNTIGDAVDIIGKSFKNKISQPNKLIAKSDLVTTVTLMSLAPIAFLPRNTVRPALCRLIAKAHVAFRGTRTNSLNGAIPLLEGGKSANAIETDLLAGGYEAIAETLRAQAPQKHPPKARLQGRAHIDAALAAGRGAVLWNFPTALGARAGLRGLAEAGMEITKLQSSAHPFSSSRFGMKYLNPINNRIDKKYTQAPVILDDRNPGEAARALGVHLAANRAVWISANGATGTPYVTPFLNGDLGLALGAPTLALLHDAPLIPTFCIPDGRGGFDFYLEEPLIDGSELSIGMRARALARQYAIVLEQYVKWHPQLWRCWNMPSTWRPGAVSEEAGLRQ